VAPAPHEAVEALPSSPASAALAARRAKLERLRSLGIEPYPGSTGCVESVERIVRRFSALPADRRTGVRFTLAGRIRSLRHFGGLCFATLHEGVHEIQLLISPAQAGAGAYTAWRECVDPGDYVVCRGEVLTTRRGELSLAVSSWQPAAKSLRPLPQPQEPSTRHRYAEMLARPQAAEVVCRRSALLRVVRSALAEADFTEVDTPLLQPHYGGGSRPFTTWSNAWNAGLHLRNSAELYLKRLVIGGVGRVFEIGRCFRNEGSGTGYFPEFTLLEALATHGDHLGMADLVEGVVRRAGSAPGARRNLDAPFRRVGFHELLSQELATAVDGDTGRGGLAELAARHRLRVDEDDTAGEIAIRLFRRIVLPRVTRPTFVLDLPLEAAVFARPSRSGTGLVEAWQLVIHGLDVAQGCSELTDPDEQRRRLTWQQERGRRLDARPDEEFLTALEYGMPPLGGFGVGIERLLMALYGGTRLRDQHTHPIVRPQRGDEKGA